MFPVNILPQILLLKVVDIIKLSYPKNWGINKISHLVIKITLLCLFGRLIWLILNRNFYKIFEIGIIILQVTLWYLFFCNVSKMTTNSDCLWVVHIEIKNIL